jgi:antitoxin CptB
MSEYKNRIYWHSRRGMLELDLILVPFVKNHFAELSEENKQRYIELLKSEDQDLFAWLMGYQIPENCELKIIVDKIRTLHCQ